MPDAHDAAVEAMAAAICMGVCPEGAHDEELMEGATLCYDVAEAAQAALVNSEAVRAALVEALDDAPYHPGASADAILAALRPGDEGGAG